MNRAGATIAELLRAGADRLAEAGIDNPRLESRLLLAHALRRSSEELIRELSADPGPSDVDTLIARRVGREPLAYILGWREFWSLRFVTSPATLVPRPDSELVVETALTLVPDAEKAPRILDLGCGTGCLLLAFLHEQTNGFGVGVDRSEAAARLARRNADVLGLADRSVFLCGHWADPIDGRFDLVLSNPPYIATGDLAGLMPEVAAYEPLTALDGGPSGLSEYRAIIATLPRLLMPAGAAVFELGSGQSGAVASIAAEAGFACEFRFDLSGVARVIILRLTP